MLKKIKSILRPIYSLIKIIYQERFSKRKLPEVINFNANDICNSKCTMCNIWKQKQDFEISPAELEIVLKDPLYKNVKHIGITGGEPTLREDLHLLYNAVIKSLPNINGLSIITNAIRKEEVIDRINKVIDVCSNHQKSFSMMVSLDGYKEIHDAVRGRGGNFESAIEVIEYFKNKGISVTTGTTISKVNVWDVEEVLYFLQKKGWYGRFRVAEFINRLYNNDRSDVIRNFDEDEKYQLCLFFTKLSANYETSPDYQRTYQSIINMLSGGDRLIGCPYQKEGVSLNSRGELAYCAPKSKIIGNTIKDSSFNLYNENLSERNRILKEDCDSCIHDYHFRITSTEKIKQYKHSFWRRYISIENKITLLDYLFKPNRTRSKKALIVGWYGTETVGDKAILAGIVNELKSKYSCDEIVIGSLIPFITNRTVKELQINAHVVDVYSANFIKSAKSSDLIIMGGGPLMDLEALAIPLHAFKIGKKYNKQNIIYGCGLGPLNDEKYLNTTKEILKLATEIKLRDKKSIEIANFWNVANTEIQYSGDPSKVFLKGFISSNKQNSKVLRCYLREWTYEYSRDLTFEEFLHTKEKFEKSLSILIKRKAEELNVEEIVFEHMHNFVIGNDDRDFSRYFIETFFANSAIKVSYNKYLSTVDTIVKSMQNSSHNICMRFHSVVFAHTLKTSFSAIDYTKGGKIKNYLTDENCIERLISIDDLLKYENSSYQY